MVIRKKNFKKMKTWRFGKIKRFFIFMMFPVLIIYLLYTLTTFDESGYEISYLDLIISKVDKHFNKSKMPTGPMHYPTEQLKEKEYYLKGIPKFNKTWYEYDIEEACNTIWELSKSNPESLPIIKDRYGSKFFKRLKIYNKKVLKLKLKAQKKYIIQINKLLFAYRNIAYMQNIRYDNEIVLITGLIFPILNKAAENAISPPKEFKLSRHSNQGITIVNPMRLKRAKKEFRVQLKDIYSESLRFIESEIPSEKAKTSLLEEILTHLPKSYNLTQVVISVNIKEALAKNDDYKIIRLLDSISEL